MYVIRAGLRKSYQVRFGICGVEALPALLCLAYTLHHITLHHTFTVARLEIHMYVFYVLCVSGGHLSSSDDDERKKERKKERLWCEYWGIGKSLLLAGKKKGKGKICRK